MNIIFFGSTSDSVLVLDALIRLPSSAFSFQLSAIVTQPPAPIGRKQILTPTPVELWAKEHTIPVCTFETQQDKPWLYENEDDVINTLETFKPDLLISACYGQKIPNTLIAQCTYGGINIHPSLLPRWRGAYPVPWSILAGDAQTGVTLITLAEKFDQGLILSQKKIPLTETDMAEDIRKKLFTIGADLLIETLPDYMSGKLKGTPQKPEDATVARRITRQDGFVPWELLQSAMNGIDIPRENRINSPSSVVCLLSSILSPLSLAVFQLFRAFSPWPGVWSEITIKREKKRLKILKAHVEGEKLILDTVQLEGKKPISWEEFEKAYL